MTKVVLGFGNSSKAPLKAWEPLHSDWKFCVLDCWSVVQKLEIPEEKVDEDAPTFFTDHSFFIEEPAVAVRFGADKYQYTETADIIRFRPDYQRLLHTEREAHLTSVLSELQGVDQLIVLADLSAPLTRSWGPGVLPAIAGAGASVTLVSLYPGALHGALATREAQAFSTALMEPGILHYTLFWDEVAQDCGHMSIASFFSVCEGLLADALGNVLRNEVPDPQWFHIV
ncbi:hypothetical protein [Flaviaesturariibacter amylovorans]|uniref:Uncharacterized protein n=1 Tax=Flaviaesturariibacter amylovorans TaxID=1084520 RepID=A0ABP8HUA6_9BACT